VVASCVVVTGCVELEWTGEQLDMCRTFSAECIGKCKLCD
jgi:hypothetical protein